MQWPHSPPHWLFSPGQYMVTAGTCRKELILRSDRHKDLVLTTLFDLAAEYGWELRAWAVLANHYHFVARSPAGPQTLRTMIKRLHGATAVELNRLDQTPARKVWFQMWDTHITFETSYLARLKYVNHNPVHHGLATRAADYPWCSASWFSQSCSRAFAQTVDSFNIDEVHIPDDF